MRISKAAHADLALIVATFIWGSTFVVVKQSLANVSPVLFVALRFWIAALVILAFQPRLALGIPLDTFVKGLVLSVTLSAGLVFQTIGLLSTEPSYSAFITSLSVLLVPILNFLIFRHRPRPQTAAGVMLAVVGLFLLLSPRLSAFSSRPGDILTLAGSVMFGFQILFVGRFVAASDYRQLMLLQMGLTAAICSIATPLLEKPFLVMNSDLILSVVLVGTLATAFTFYVQASAQRLTTANRAALIFSMEPFFAALFAFWIMGSVLTGMEWAGGVLIAAGILVSELQRTGAKDSSAG